MRKTLKILISLSTIISIFLFAILPACSDEGRISELESKISELEQKLNEKENTTSTLESNKDSLNSFNNESNNGNEISDSFVGSINSNVYHYPSCGHAKKIKSYNEIWFSSVQDAKNHGYRPCKVCKPPG